MFKRELAKKLSTPASLLVLGPRQTGKTTLLGQIEPIFALNLLSQAEFLKYNRDPDLLYKELSVLPKKEGRVWIDEVQKIPALLDVVHRCIDEFPGIAFILSGSSARKLRRGSANLLGGRALDLRLHPLTIFELAESFDLKKVLRFGSLPKIYSIALEAEGSDLACDYLTSYVTTYLSDEIKAEATVRNLASFQTFLEVAAAQFGQEINYSSIATESQVSDDLVRSYYSVLEDTLIGFFLQPFHASIRKRLSARQKFYFFDSGVTRALLGLHRSPVSNIERGRLFEQFVLLELKRLNDYFSKELKFSFWKAHSGAEVDIVIERGGEVLFGIECKSREISKRDFSGLAIFSRDFPKAELIVCAPVTRDRIEEGIKVLHPKSLLQEILSA